MEGKNSERERMYNKLILRKERESMCCGKEAKTKGIVFTKSSSFFFFLIHCIRKHDIQLQCEYGQRQ